MEIDRWGGSYSVQYSKIAVAVVVVDPRVQMVKNGESMIATRITHY